MKEVENVLDDIYLVKTKVGCMLSVRVLNPSETKAEQVMLVMTQLSTTLPSNIVNEI